ncbi:unnamed protein product [Rotaria socialis]|uniref:Uncharacterized protein n=1 Tax=Rotaria socialis TaxID=392032 RepID=A0A821X827_9BILA|nr:unnamed protein product [Rotaria socialis]
MVTIINCLCTIARTSSSTNTNSHRIDPIVRSLKRIVDTALQEDAPEDIDNDSLIEQLSQILEQEEGFRIADHKPRSMYQTGEDESSVPDGSGDFIGDEKLPSFYSNIELFKNYLAGIDSCNIFGCNLIFFSEIKCFCKNSHMSSGHISVSCRVCISGAH